MPSRAVTLAIVIFWLATLAWMVYRTQETEPGLPPRFTFDLADEAKQGPAKEVNWRVTFQTLGKDQPKGNCRTYPRRLAQQMFLVFCVYETHHHPLQAGPLEVNKLTCTSWVSARGELMALKVTAELEPPKGGTELARGSSFQMAVAVTGFEPPIARDEKQRPPTDWERTGSLRSFINPLHPHHQLPNLRPGQTWTATVLDPLDNLRAGPPAGQPLQTVVWQARVSTDELTWTGAVHPCWRIDYTDDGGAARARTWARQADGKVLRHEVVYPDGVLKLVRKVGSEP
jgi:hypothetical protein